MPTEICEPRRRVWLEYTALVLIIALAAVLRFVGLRWGLPDSLHDYSYHPDEFFVVGTAFGAIYLQKSLLPRFYQYPSLYIYLTALAIAVALGYGASPSSANIYLIARVVTALMGTAAVAVTWWAGTVLWGRGAGLLAALILCIAPLHVQHSHFATVDVPSTLFVAAALGYMGLILKRGDLREYILAGLMCGFAAGSKYNAGLVLLSVIAAHFLRDKASLRSLVAGKLWASIGCALAGFVISTPGCILQTQEFLHGLTYEMRHAATGHGLVFAGTGNGFLYTLTHSLLYGLGPVVIIFLLAIVTALFRRNKAVWAILVFLIPYYALISLSQVRFARYTLPMFPAIALICGWVIIDWCGKLGGRGALVDLGRRVWGTFITLVILINFTLSYFLTQSFLCSSPQEQAARWVFQNIPKGSSIGMMDPPWFYSPPLSKDFGFGTLNQRREAATKSPYNIVIFNDCEKSGSWYVPGKAPQWVMVSDFELMDANRLEGDKSISPEDQDRVKRYIDNIHLITHHYSEARSFYGPFVYNLFREAPHDMHYPDANITIYELKK